MIRSFLGYAAAFIATAHAWAAPTGISDAKIDEVMRRSGVWKQVESLVPAALQGIEQQMRSKDAKPLPPEEAAGLKAAVERGFGADAVRARMRESLRETLTEESAGAALRWLDSERGRLFTRLEEENDAADGPAREGSGAEALRAASARRRDLLERLGRATAAGEYNADLMIGMTVMSAETAALVDPTFDPEVLKVFRERMAQQRAALAQALARRALAIHALAYREASDDDLLLYVDFNESAAGREYNRVIGNAFAAAALAGAQEITRFIAGSRDASRRRS